MNRWYHVGKRCKKNWKKILFENGKLMKNEAIFQSGHPCMKIDRYVIIRSPNANPKVYLDRKWESWALDIPKSDLALFKGCYDVIWAYYDSNISSAMRHKLKVRWIPIVHDLWSKGMENQSNFLFKRSFNVHSHLIRPARMSNVFDFYSQMSFRLRVIYVWIRYHF